MSKSKELLNKLEEMAFNKKGALDKLEAMQFTVVMHIIKIILLPNDQSKKKWLKELETCRKILSQKNYGKKGANNYSKSILNKTFWIEPLEEPRDREARIKELNQEGYNIKTSLESKVEILKEYIDKFINTVLDNEPFKT